MSDGKADASDSRPRSAWKSASPALIVAALLLLPFARKAFTIDDTLFLKQAGQVLKDPLHPTAFQAVWSEAPVPLRMSAIMPSGPVMAYLLVPSILLDGAEWAAHLAVLATMLLALVATAALALRLGLDEAEARWAALLLACTPSAVGMAATAMPDVPAMAFGVLGLERALAFRQDRRWHQAVLSALGLALGALSRPHAILLVAVAGLLFLVQGGSLRDRIRGAGTAWLPLLAAPLLFLAVLVMTRDPVTGAGATAFAAETFSGWAFVGSNLVAYAVHWVLVVPLAIPWTAMRWKRLIRGPVLYIGAAAGTAAVALATNHHRYAPVIGPIAGLGLAVLWDVFADARTRRDLLQGALGAALLVPLPIVAYLHLPSKYLLVSAPAAVVLVVRALRSRGPRFARPVLAATLVLGAALGLLIVRADADFAGLARRATADWIAPRVAAGQRVWFSGHWGFQWYAEKAGARPLTSTPPLPAAGDFAVADLAAFGVRILARNDLAPLAAMTEGKPGGRIIAPERCAGFYSNSWGFLPWTWSSKVNKRFVLFQFVSRRRDPAPPD